MLPPSGHRLEHMVADLVAMGVVDMLEPVEIDKHQPEGMIVSFKNDEVPQFGSTDTDRDPDYPAAFPDLGHIVGKRRAEQG